MIHNYKKEKFYKIVFTGLIYKTFTVWSLALMLLPKCGQIEKYMQNTHAKTHSSYTVDIVQIFRVSRAGEVEQFGKVLLHNL